MVSFKKLGWALLVLGVNHSYMPAAWADKPATPASVRIGYFNVALVKSAYPEAAGAEALRLQAEGQLRHDLEDANKKIQQMQDEKKSTEDIQKAVRDNQLAFDAKRQAIVQLLQTQNQLAKEKLLEVVNQVAKERGLDLILDADGIYLGGKTVLDDGVDITPEVVKRLSPMTAQTSAPSK